MSSNQTAISVQSVSKRYELYDAPRDRLKQFVLPRLRRLAQKENRNYFREFWALRDISFEVAKGESVGIIGRNGSGKSTLLQIITGTLSPTTGSVITHGRIAALLELGSGFNPDFTGRENVYLNGALLGFTKEEIDQKFDSIAAFADIGQHLDQPVKTYSSGMLVRLAFSVQVQVQPDILIIDEALAVGDALFQKRCFQQLERLISEGVSLLFVSHDQESVRTLTNRALLLNKGKSVAWGLSSEVVLKYRKLLHEEESAYFSSLTQSLSPTSKVDGTQSDTRNIEILSENSLSQTPQNEDSPGSVKPQIRSSNLSFGSGGVIVERVATLNADGESCTVFYPGDKIRIRVDCSSFIDTSKLNIGVRIRNKEGIKIHSWGTLNQDIQVMAGIKEESIFWKRDIKKDEKFSVYIEFDCSLGPNLYEIQASVSYEDRPDYTSQHLLHWIDEAAFFQVLMKRDEYFFGGVLDLHMSANW